MDRVEQGCVRMLLLRRQPPPLPEPTITVYAPTTTVTTSWLCSTLTTTPVAPRGVGSDGSSLQVYLAVFLTLGLFFLGGLIFLLVVSVCRAVGGRCGEAFGHKVKVFSAPVDNCVGKIANAVARWTEDDVDGERGLVFPVRDWERDGDVEIYGLTEDSEVAP